MIDDGWAAASDWATRMQAVQGVLDRLERSGRPAILLLTTARTEADQPPRPSLPLPWSPELRTRLAALRPKSWPPDHAAAAASLQGVKADAVTYVADGIADGNAADDAAFGRALAAVGPVTELRSDPVAARVMPAHPARGRPPDRAA